MTVQVRNKKNNDGEENVAKIEGGGERLRQLFVTGFDLVQSFKHSLQSSVVGRQPSTRADFHFPILVPKEFGENVRGGTARQ